MSFIGKFKSAFELIVDYLPSLRKAHKWKIVAGPLYGRFTMKCNQCGCTMDAFGDVFPYTTLGKPSKPLQNTSGIPEDCDEALMKRIHES